MARKTLLIDFDGVLHQYTGEFTPNLNPPLPQARAACCILAKKYRLVCFTSRPVEQVEPWLSRWAFPKMLVTNEKLPAFLIIDDRAICFQGVWTDNFIKSIAAFQPHWKTDSTIADEDHPLTDSDDSQHSSEQTPLPDEASPPKCS